jgi:hypothetical protein
MGVLRILWTVGQFWKRQGVLCIVGRDYRIRIFFSMEKLVDRVHSSWTKREQPIHEFTMDSTVDGGSGFVGA